jgi:hypothetical protein
MAEKGNAGTDHLFGLGVADSEMILGNDTTDKAELTADSRV